MPEQIRVVLVDDHHLMREGIATILGTEPRITVVGQAATGEESLGLVRDLAPDVVCMDVEMPGMGGIEATRALVRDPGVSAQVLVLTTFEREDYLIAALEAGASGFLLKNSRPEQLRDAILAVAAGEALLAPELTMAVIRRALTRPGGPATLGVPPTGAPAPASAAPGPAATTSPAAVWEQGEHITTPLTDREAEVLRLLALGMSNEEIAAHLYVGRATVKTHVSNVLTKLGLRDRVQAVAYAYRTGLVPLEIPRQSE